MLLLLKVVPQAVETINFCNVILEIEKLQTISIIQQKP